MNTGLLITMGFVALGTTVAEKVCIALGKMEYAEWIRLAGISTVGTTAIGVAVSFLNTARKAIQ